MRNPDEIKQLEEDLADKQAEVERLRKQNASLWALKDELQEALRSVDTDCRYCGHRTANYTGECDAADGDCEKCTAACACKNCIDGSNYEYKPANRKTGHREPNIKAVYLAGKMAGLHDLGRSSFLEAEEVVHKKGFVVLNPAALPEGLPHERYMPMCMSMINAADAVVLLEGWEDSPGAQVEKAYAEYQKKPVFKIQELTEGSACT